LLSTLYLRIPNSYCGELNHVAGTYHAALHCGSALGIILGVELPALIVLALLGHVFKRRCSVPGSGKVQPSNALCTSVSSHQQPLELPSTSMVIISTLSHGNDTALSTGPPVEDEPEPPICGYNSEKPKDESVTYIEERTGDEITEYAHTADAASIARHLNVDPK
jgi:hypothetical protein